MNICVSLCLCVSVAAVRVPVAPRLEHSSVYLGDVESVGAISKCLGDVESVGAISKKNGKSPFCVCVSGGLRCLLFFLVKFSPNTKITRVARGGSSATLCLPCARFF